jgi:hypothetical protein
MNESNILQSDDADELNIGDNHTVIEEEDYLQPFMHSHPQAKTHMVKMCKAKREKIPDFVGGSLPRPNYGDREYYCCTMLTLFKPWRSGKMLKLEEQTWDDSFNNFEFSDRQIELMKFFTIKYDCLDARDDFSAQRNSEQRMHGEQAPFSDNVLDDIEFSHVEREMIEEEFCIDEDALDTEGPPGRNNLIRKRNMQEVENIMRNAGWLDKSPDGLPDVEVKVPIIPNINRDGSYWRKEVLARKKEVLANKNQHAPLQTNEDDKNKDYNGYDKVEIVNMSFFNKSFKADSIAEQNIIDDTVRDFNLNTEQERAFRLVANHVTVHEKKKLYMYLGGMGGTGKSQVIKALIRLFEKRKESHRFLVLAPR